MTPQTKAQVLTLAALVSVVAVPVLLIALHDWFYVMVIAVTYGAVLALFFREMYLIVNAELLRPIIEDQQATESFAGDPLKLHFYRGFRKFFDGNLDQDQLQHWLEHHRPQI